jgi:hypothetical protein
MSTNVLKLPGNYKLLALNGSIYIESLQEMTHISGGYIYNEAQDYIKNQSGQFIENLADSYINNEAQQYIINRAVGDYIENKAGSYIFNKTDNQYIKNEAGDYIENLANSYINNEATSYIKNIVLGGYIKNEAGQEIENLAGAFILNESSTYIDNKSGDYFNVEAGGFIKLVSLTDDITLISPSLIEFDSQTIKIGISDGQQVDPKAQFINDLIPAESETYDFGTENNRWNNLYIEQVKSYSEENVQNPYFRPFDPTDVYGATPGNTAQIETANAQREASGTFFKGGIGIQKDLNVGGFIYGRIEIASTSLSVNVTSTNVNLDFYPTFALNTGNQFLFIDSTGLYGGLTYNPSQGLLTTDKARIASTQTAISTMSAALTITGGVGVGQDIVIGNGAFPREGNTGTIGKETLEWADAYVNNLYTKFITNTNSNITIAPATELTEIIGDIRVRGVNPIGTHPVVSNTLYVTMDGNDTNDGRALDASRACRTVGGAIKSPYFKEGTQILVSAGFYLEDNPIRLKPYTSVRGSDIRTTFLEPINKTQDLFHLESGCYLNYMTFLNGRSGLLEGPYESGFNRGAYATAFPPLEQNQRIDLFHSPYVQNCTNQSGPWLRDGTMFIPNQTVQVPVAVGTGSWAANTSSIVVKISSGTVELGMAINAGQQNPGFFNARTLLLANKPFIQEQVVTYVDETFNSGNFVYDQAKCARDTGLLIDSIAIDLLQDSTSESIFAGLQYWRQSGYVDAIGSQITTTTAAINFLKTQAAATVNNIAASQVNSVSARFDEILEILNTNTNSLSNGNFAEWISNKIISNYTASTISAVLNGYYALVNNRTTITNAVINFVKTTYPSYPLNTATCIRDTGYIIDSVAFDLLHGGNKQSVKTGVYYFGYTNNTSEVSGEVPQTITAYRFLKGIIKQVVQGKPVTTKYQNSVNQVIAGLNSATFYEADVLGDRLDLITEIIRNGPDEYQAVGKRIPINLTENTSTGVQNAFDLLLANRSFIVAETIAYINSTSNIFIYNREKCRRDVGILVENIAYDAAFGGNQKSVESGLSYFDGVISRIAGQEVQTISAIDYLNELAENIIVNVTCTDLLQVSPGVTTATYKQVINTALQGGSVSSDSIKYLKNIITTIIDNGPAAAPQVYTSPGPDSAFISAEILIQANRSFIQLETINYINHVIIPSTNPGYFPYSEIKCRRDTGLIIDALAQDLLYNTYYQNHSNSQSTFAGLQYWEQDFYVGNIKNQLNPTLEAVKYLKDLSVKIIQNITPDDDLILRYQNISIQNTSTYQAATSVEADIIRNNFNVIIEIIGGNKKGWSDRIIANGRASNIQSKINAFNNLRLNAAYLGAEVNAFIQATNWGFSYDTNKCARDVAYMVDAVAFDMLHGGNRQSVQNGLYYYGFSTLDSNVYNETTQTIAAFNYLGTIIGQVIQNQNVTAKQKEFKQIFSSTTATIAEATAITNSVNTITSIINLGPSVASLPRAIAMTASSTASVLTAYELIYSNKQFLIEETIAFIDETYNSGKFNYNEAKCYRDVGLILDAVTQDIILGGNSKSIEAGVSYWSGGYNSIAGQESTTTLAMNRARDVALAVASNIAVTATTGTIIQQIINPFFDYGYEYGPQEAIKRNFKIITDIIEKGPLYAPPIYAGGGLFSLVGINGADVKLSPRVVSFQTITNNTYRIGLDTPTIGFGNNATLYFGESLIFPYRDKQVDIFSYEYTGNTSTWAQRKIDPIGSMGGSLVDGGVISDRSPIQSFVYDAFTQVNQGGRGIHIIRDGYAQLVSVFTIFCSIGVEVDSGGIASIVNSNANFGTICLQAKGYGKRKFSGHVYNPSYKSYPESPQIPGSDYLDQYYPSGFWPNEARVMIFLPDLDDRPHISLVMEIEAPETVRDFTGKLLPQLNEQGFPGFLNANPTTSSLTTGSIIISPINTDGIYIGNRVYIRDQFGKTTSTNIDSNGNFIPYSDDDTFVTNVEFKSVTLSKPLTSGGSDPDNTALTINDNYFDLYFCGNSYYTVLSSEIGNNPQYNKQNDLIPDGINILSPQHLGLSVGQVQPHIDAMTHLNTLTNRVISNTAISSMQTGTNTTTQFINLLINEGALATAFINLRFADMINIIGAANLTAAENIVRPSLRKTIGPAVQGAGAAVSLIEANIEFLADEVAAYTEYYNWGSGGSTLATYTDDYKELIKVKCQRDTKIILRRLIYDIQAGSNYNMVMAGLSYWRRQGTYHIVQLGENITRTDKFPDGAIVNFYQRSYMSASGYVFEYVGAGIDYGALPQRGVADPKTDQEVVQLNSGKVFFTTTDQNGDFRIGPELVISQATGVLSGRTFTRSLFANLTPFILAIESGGG